ncbi:MAG: hypothetical protein QXZ12_08340 [Thermoplasmata archaeon]
MSQKIKNVQAQTDDCKEILDNIQFYGISAKRYCLFRIGNDEIEILKYSTHGLGHLKDIDVKQIWKDIITKNFRGYTERKAVSQITITKPSILKRFKKLNEGKPLDKQIKSFNFMLIGSETNSIIPCLPYSKDISGIQYKPFTDYTTEKSSNELPSTTNSYWKSLEDILTQYVMHNDNKFDYVDHIAQRKQVIADRIRYIGKELNNLDESVILGIDDNSYIEYENLKEFYKWILTLKPKDVRDKRISERELKRKKVEARKGKILNFKMKTNRELFKLYKSR